jgi:hypothetical protein
MPYESDPITSKLNELVGSQELYMGLLEFDELNPAEQALIGTWELANEVYNGGFMQYFYNSSGEHAVSMVGVLRSFGALGAAAIVEEAINLAGPGSIGFVERDYVKAIQSTPSDTRDKLASLARSFFDQSDDMHLRLYRYLATHRDQISAPTEFWTEASIQ